MSMVIVLLCVFTAGVFAGDTLNIADKFILDVPDGYISGYDNKHDLYYMMNGNGEDSTFLVLTDLLPGVDNGEDLREAVENGSLNNEERIFTGDPEQGDGFRWRHCLVSEADDWYYGAFVYYDTNVLKVFSVNGSSENVDRAVGCLRAAESADVPSPVLPGGSDETSEIPDESLKVEKILMGDGFVFYNNAEYIAAGNEEDQNFILVSADSQQMYYIEYHMVPDVMSGSSGDQFVKDVDSYWEILNTKLDDLRFTGAPEKIHSDMTYMPMTGRLENQDVPKAYVIYDDYMLNITCITGTDGDLKALTDRIQPAVLSEEELYTTGEEAFWDEDYEKALQFIIPAVVCGNSRAQFRLAVMYDFGKGLEQSSEEAVKYYILAADQGYEFAQFNLAISYERGEGVEQSYEKAIYYYKLASDQGYGSAQYNLGVMYEYGKGVEQSYEKALEYYRMALENGEEKAAEKIEKLSSLVPEATIEPDMDAAEMYEIGEEAYQNEDYEKALRYLVPAAEAGNPRAQFRLATMYDFAKGVEHDAEKAVKYYILAAEQGHMNAQYNLAISYETGDGVEQSYEMAVKYYIMAADQGHANAQFNLGVDYEIGEGVEQSYDMARKYYEMAADQGVMGAQYNLACIYDFGKGVEKDPEMAVKYYTMAADQGHANAQYNLAISYENGEGVEKSVEMALKYYKMAAEQGHASACYNLGIIYEYGQGVDISYEEALKYYRMALENGSEDAAAKVEKLSQLTGGSGK